MDKRDHNTFHHCEWHNTRRLSLKEVPPNPPINTFFPSRQMAFSFIGVLLPVFEGNIISMKDDMCWMGNGIVSIVRAYTQWQLSAEYYTVTTSQYILPPSSTPVILSISHTQCTQCMRRERKHKLELLLLLSVCVCCSWEWRMEASERERERKKRRRICAHRERRK